MQSGNDTSQIITRSFNATITLSPTYIERPSGKVYFELKRNDASEN
jgi:hypothetical protein